jgi:hypothetical protein
MCRYANFRCADDFFDVILKKLETKTKPYDIKIRKALLLLMAFV